MVRSADTLSSPSDLYPIRTVSRLTGVNAITLRAWERRYGLVRPVRTPSGHRLYRREEIDLIQRVVGLLDQGIAISQVQQSLKGAVPTAPTDATHADSRWVRYRAEMIAAIGRFDEERLEDLYNETLALYPIELVTQSLLLPLLVELGQRWEANAQCGVAEEHFFGVYLRNKLGARYHHRPRGNQGPRLLTACLPGEQHEIGLLLFSLTAYDHGLRPVLLGANTPLEELAQASRNGRCQAIVLSGSIKPEAQVLTSQLPQLVVDAGIPVFVGGLASIFEHNAIVAAGAMPLGNELLLGTRRIRNALGPVMLTTAPKTPTEIAS